MNSQYDRSSGFGHAKRDFVTVNRSDIFPELFWVVRVSSVPRSVRESDFRKFWKTCTVWGSGRPLPPITAGRLRGRGASRPLSATRFSTKRLPFCDEIRWGRDEMRRDVRAYSQRQEGGLFGRHLSKAAVTKMPNGAPRPRPTPISQYLSIYRVCRLACRFSHRNHEQASDFPQPPSAGHRA